MRAIDERNADSTGGWASPHHGFEMLTGYHACWEGPWWTTVGKYATKSQSFQNNCLPFPNVRDRCGSVLTITCVWDAWPAPLPSLDCGV